MTPLFCSLARRGAFVSLLLQSFVARAGHDYVASFAIHALNDGAFSDSEAPVSFGSPVPQWVELEELSHLTVIGAGASQLSVADRWPSGDVRWIQVDTLIEMPSGASKMVVHLTTGALGTPGPDVLVGNPDESIEFIVGGTRWTIRPDGRIGVVSNGATKPAEASLSLRWMETEGLATSSLRIQRNGPVAGVLELRRQRTSGALESIWFQVIAGASTIEIQHCLFVPPSDEASSAHLGLALDLGNESDWLSSNPSAERGPSIITRRGASESLSLVFDPSTWEEVRSNGRVSLEPSSNETPAGGWVRRRLALSALSDSEMIPPERLFFKKALTLNTYNDAHVFCEAVYPADVYTGASASGAFGEFREEIYRALAAPGMAASRRWLDLRSRLDQILASGELARALPGETLTLWSRLTGDAAVAGLYQEWSDGFLDAFETIQSSPFGAVATAGQCLDLVAAVGSKLARKRLENWLRVLNERFKAGDPELREFASAQGASLLSVLGQTSRMFAGIDPMESQALDLLETFVRWGLEKEPNERVWIEGYYTTGTPEYLRGAGASVAADSDASATLKYLVDHPNRFSVWKDLEIERTRKLKDGFDLRWTSPARSQRVRLKAFADEARSDSEQVFPEGDNIPANESLAASGQTRTVFVEWSKGAARPSFMARYFERGSALPALKREISVAATASSVAKTVNTMLVVAVSAIGCLIFVVLWKRFISV